MGFGCFKVMLVSVQVNGVNPDAYKQFVDYTVNGFTPSGSAVGATFAEALSSTVSNITLMLLLVIWLIFSIVIIIMFHKGLISPVAMIVAIAAMLLIITIYYVLATASARYSIFKMAPAFQESLVDVVIYSSNSVFRDFLYLAYCK